MSILKSETKKQAPTPAQNTTANNDIFSERNVWIFDLDNTLYSADYDLHTQMEVRIGAFVEKLTGLTGETARKLQKKYFFEHGTTLNGLITHHDIDPADYLKTIYDIDFSSIKKDEQLRRALKRLNGRKIVFTNAELTYAETVLSKLGIEDLFEDVFDIIKADLCPKPEKSTYENFVERYGVDPHEAIMVEDMVRNLKPAFDMGMATLWINTGISWSRNGHEDHIIHAETPNLSKWLSDFTAQDNS